MNIVKNHSIDVVLPKWHFTKDELLKIPSILDGISTDLELKYRQQAASFMQIMGEKLINGVKDHRVKMSCCMCVAMIHFHRFFVVHSMRIFDPRDVAAACLFLAGKSEEFPRKLELISRTWYNLKNDVNEKERQIEHKVYEESGEYIVFLESVVLQTIGFKLEVSLPHPLILKYAQKFIGEKRSLMETAYFFATDTLFVTNWCVRYKMETLACVCIYLTCAWAEYEIPHAPDSLPWYKIIDNELTEALLNELADEFSKIYEVADKSQLVSTKLLAERRNKVRPTNSSVLSSNTSTSHSNNITNPASTILAPPPKPPQLNNKQEVKAEIQQIDSKLIDGKQRKLTLSEYRERKAAASTKDITNSCNVVPVDEKSSISSTIIKQNGSLNSPNISRSFTDEQMQPSSSYHYNKHLLSTNNIENSSNSANRLLSNSSTRAASWKQLGVHSSQNNSSNNYQSQQSYSVQQHNQNPQSLTQQSQQQTWKRSYQKYSSNSSSQPSLAVQMPDRSTSPPSPKFIAFTDADGGSPPLQRYKSSSSSVIGFQPSSLHLPIVTKLRHSGSSNNYNGNNMNDLEDGELT